MLLEKGHLNVLPCAGITLIRFYGYNLSPWPAGESFSQVRVGTPRENAEVQELLGLLHVLKELVQS